MNPFFPSSTSAASLRTGGFPRRLVTVSVFCHRPTGSERFARGFALVVTLSLMILLTVIAVGLLTLSSVSLRAATQSKDTQTARANARMALIIAIGELQKNIGPDQRVTAPADLKSPPTAMKPATMPQWVGVYGNSSRATYTDAPDTTADKDLYKPTLLNWLVSGNETNDFSSSLTGSDFGKITKSPTAIPFSPTDAVGNIASANASSSNLTINGTRAALLVGPNSAGPYDPTQNQFVAAPVVATKNALNQTNGGYAYWVSDEGTKARINLQDNYRTATANIDKAKSYSFVSQRAGIESMRRDLTASTEIGIDYNPASDQIQNLVTTGQLPLLNSATLSSVAKARFHDLTAYSSSLLVDSYSGGLKLDLSAAIEGNTPSDSTPIFSPVKTSDFGLPTWGMLRSWAKTKAARNSPAAPAAIAPHPYNPVTNTPAFGPVISTCTLGVGIEKGDDVNSLRVQFFPFLILWNPHAAPIQAANYELGMAERNGGTVDIQLIGKDGKHTSWGKFSLARGDRPTIVPDSATATADAATGTGFFRFKVEGSEIPPGESHVYVLKPSQNQTPYDPNGGSTLVRADSSPPLGKTRYLTGPSVTYDGALYSGSGTVKPRVYLATTNTGMSAESPNNAKGLAGDRFEAVLTSPGELSSGFTAATPVYQAILENCAVCYAHGPKNLMDFAVYLEDTLLGTAGLEPIFVIRSKMTMESQGDNGYPPYTGAMGRQGSNRWLATTNPLAPYTKRTKAEYLYNGGNPVHGCVLVNRWIEGEGQDIGMSPLGSPYYLSGIGADQSGNGGFSPVILRDVLPDDLPLLSLGQLQHAPFSVYGFSPTYCFGNSKIDLRFSSAQRTQTYLPNYVAPPGAPPNTYSDTLYDLPWHLNRALWDRYFVSSVPENLTQADIDDEEPLPNARMSYVRRNGKAPLLSDIQSSSPAALSEAAANLMVAGGFNINSTSVDAWRAVLTGTNQVAPSKEFANPSFQAALGLNAMMPRFARDLRRSNAQDSTGVLNMWNCTTKDLGNRELVLLGGKGAETPAAASSRLAGVAGELAQKIVAEVRYRGPFLSLADFINRDLTTGDKGLRSALQAAIDKCQAPYEVNPVQYPDENNYADGEMWRIKASSKTITQYDTEAYLGGPTSDVASSSDSIGYRNRFDQTAKVLTQADVLTTLGPALSARSDTFLIRCYGEATNAAGERTAGAWCEAVIQRTPDYVDSADDATVAPGALTSDINKTFGRSLEIISFRWLTANEI